MLQDYKSMFDRAVKQAILPDTAYVLAAINGQIAAIPITDWLTQLSKSFAAAGSSGAYSGGMTSSSGGATLVSATYDPIARRLSLFRSDGQELTANMSSLADGQSVKQVADALAALTAKVNAGADPLGGLTTSLVDDISSTSVMYALKVGNATTRVPWCVSRAATTPTGVGFDYAGPNNNPSISTASAAWSARTTLTYGSAQQS